MTTMKSTRAALLPIALVALYDCADLLECGLRRNCHAGQGLCRGGRLVATATGK